MLKTIQMIQELLVKNRKTINRFFKIWWTLVITWLIITTQVPGLSVLWHELGELAATTSLVAFWLSLTPSIMKRLKINKPPALLAVRTLLMLYRRELGITMWIFAIVHYAWSRVLPVLAIGGDLLDVSTFETMGFMSFVLITPLFFTSNDASQHGRFKNAWKWLHRLSYLVVWLLFFHIALQEFGTKALVTLTIAILEVVSLIVSWKRKRAKSSVLQSQS